MLLAWFLATSMPAATSAEVDAADCNAHELGAPALLRSGSRSSHGQDLTVARVFGFKTNGYFVDLGANHAERNSNTAALEEHLDWSGLCIEPNPAYWPGYEERRCTLLKSVVGQRDGDEAPFVMRHQNSGLVGALFDNSPEELAHIAAEAAARAESGSGQSLNAAAENAIVMSPTRSLRSILEDANAPRIIDYLSIDVEGAEFYILAEFPFDRYQFLAITVERPRQLRPLLEANGYVYVKDHGLYGDELYLHRDLLPNFPAVFRYYHIAKPLVLSKLGWAIPNQQLHPAEDFIVIFDAFLCRGQGRYPWEGPQLHARMGGFHKGVLYQIDFELIDERGDKVFIERAAVVLPEEEGSGIRKDEVEIDMPLELEMSPGVERGMYDLRLTVHDAKDDLSSDEALLALKIWERVAFQVAGCRS